MVTAPVNLSGFESSTIFLIFIGLNHLLYFINSYYTLSFYLYFGLSYNSECCISTKQNFILTRERRKMFYGYPGLITYEFKH